MTENDYIAEYIKEKYPSLLGLDFAVWKMFHVASNFVGQFVEAVKSIPYNQLEKALEAAQGEREPETDEDEEGDMEVTKDHPRYKEFEGDYYDNTVEVEYTPKCRKS